MSTYHKDHPHYQALEEVLKLHLERYGEPWEKRGPLIQDILNTLFKSLIILWIGERKRLEKLERNGIKEMQ